MQQRCIICNWMRKCTTKTQDLMIITLAQLYFSLHFLSSCFYWVTAHPSPVWWLSGGVDLLWKYSPLQMNTLLFHWHHCRCSEMQGEMGSGKVKRGRKYFWQFSRRGNVSRTRPFSSFVVPDAQTQARWLTWNHLSTTGETIAMWKTAFTPNNVSRPTKSLNCWRLFCWLLFPKL